MNDSSFSWENVPAWKRFLAQKLGLSPYIKHLEKQVKKLMWDQGFGMLSSQGLHYALDNLKPRTSYQMAYLDLDCLKSLNSIYGYDEVNRRIEKTFTRIWNPRVVIGRVFSGDEILILVEGNQQDLKQVMTGIRRNGLSQGISFTSVVRQIDTSQADLSIDELLEEMGRQLLNIKQGHARWSNQVAISAAL